LATSESSDARTREQLASLHATFNEGLALPELQAAKSLAEAPRAA
jgi:hypothetical protein